MNIIGIIVILTLPYMAGYILKCLMNSKETNQIETYLIGFFFVLFLQGIVLVPCYMLFGMGFSDICTIMPMVTLAIIVLFFITLIVNILIRLKYGKKDVAYRPKMHPGEWAVVAFTTFLGIMIAYRVHALRDYLRSDIMLPTVRTTLATGTIYKYNPIISQAFSVGLITSKKFISLPIYYAYLSSFYKIDETLLLYFVLTLQTVACTYMACLKFIIPILRNRRKVLVFGIFFMSVVLSGDYFKGAICKKLLWNGYAGETIVATVMLPYCMYIATDWYRMERGDKNSPTPAARIVYIIKLMLVLLASLFITSISTGVVIILIEFAFMGIACGLRFRMQEGKK